ncbi:zinc finger CCCH domain-containing protein 24 [Salvia divinorum]|uniref:Zinc finger CCCH domain-containing protein 24 n=1 Tax=Salvia divinorum TaxID=28513 RepID=A0ABD1HRE3_SALDI
MAEIPPTETLTSVEHQDSTDQPNPSVSPAPPSAVGINLPEKRKREVEPEPEPSADKPKHPLWKTSLCSYFRRSGELCSHGETCRYAHGEDELRPRPDNTWDPTSERAKKMAKTNEQDEAVEEGGVMMTEALEEDGEESSSGLSKCIVNLPMKWSSDNFRPFLNEKGIVFKSAKKKKGMIVGFVTFESAEQSKTAVEKLDGQTVGNNRTLKVSDVIQRPFEKNSKAALPEKPSPDNDDENDSLLSSDSASKARSARDAVTPLAHMSYSDQLEHKKNSLAQILKRLTRNARKACPNGISLPEWILKAREIGGLPCKLEGIIESPLVNGYRNKCEFSVGNSLQGKHTVGFLLGNFREGVTAVEEPVDCPNVSRIACKYAAVFQEFLQQSSLPIWNRLNNSGFWRQLTVREGRQPCQIDADNAESSISEVMLMVQVCTLGSDEGKVKEELHRLAQAFSAGSTAESPPLPLTTLVIQDHTGISNAAPSDAPLRYIFLHRGGDCGLEIADDVAEPRIHDHISNLRFSISPSAFFQVNTLAAERLYSLAGDWADLGPDTLLFDVCCGTGTIGLTLAHRVGMVVGIEMNASAVSDAERNAEANGIKNCRFVCGKAEDVIGSLMKEYLSLPEKQDESRETSENNESEVNSSEENINSVDGVVGTEHSSVVNHVNGHAVNGCSKDEAKLEKDSISQSSSNPIQQFKNVVAIVDPPRVGLHPTVIKVLRTQSRLRRLVYISCNPESLVANAIELCTPSPDKSEKGNNKNNRGWRNMSAAGLARHRSKSMPESEPFKPVKAMAVDLFPHTPHCELVMLLER